jgi:hypothetical protein
MRRRDLRSRSGSHTVRAARGDRQRPCLSGNALSLATFGHDPEALMRIWRWLCLADVGVQSAGIAFWEERDYQKRCQTTSQIQIDPCGAMPRAGRLLCGHLSAAGLLLIPLGQG